jgi:hypothetical protein
MTINQGILTSFVSEELGFMLVLADRSGYVYAAYDYDNEAIMNPSAFVKRKGLTPMFSIGWASGVRMVVKVALPSQT